MIVLAGRDCPRTSSRRPAMPGRERRTWAPTMPYFWSRLCAHVLGEITPSSGFPRRSYRNMRSPRRRPRYVMRLRRFLGTFARGRPARPRNHVTVGKPALAARRIPAGIDKRFARRTTNTRPVLLPSSTTTLGLLFREPGSKRKAAMSPWDCDANVWIGNLDGV